MRQHIREIVFVAMLTGVPVGAWWFAFRPANARNAQTMAVIEARQGKLRALNQATATVGDLKVEIASLEDAVKFFRSKLPSEKEIDKVLQEVWQLAEVNQLNTKSIRTLKTSEESMLTDPNGPYAEQPISMQLEGSYQGFYSFLLALELQPRIMRIQQMKIEKPAKGEEGTIVADCTVSVFFERAGKE